MNLIRKRIIRDLRQALTKGEYPPGTHLVESELCARFKVSRTPVREALAQLEKEGFVRIIPAAGARVVELTAEDVAHIYDVLIVLEGAACLLASKHITDEQIGKLEEYNLIFEKFLGHHNREFLFEVSDRFHFLITSASGNPYLIEMRSNFRALVDRLSRICPYIDGQMEESLVEHREIVSALKARNPVLAEFVMREHLESVKKNLVVFVRNRDRQAKRSEETARSEGQHD